jgi:hypothetical protein
MEKMAEEFGLAGRHWILKCNHSFWRSVSTELYKTAILLSECGNW